MDNDSLSALEKLKQLKSVKKPEIGLDPNIFFTQLPNIVDPEITNTNNDVDIFGSTTNTEALNNTSNLSEDELFAGQTVKIVPSSNFEAIEESKESKIAAIEKALANTKIVVQGAVKVEEKVEDKPFEMVKGIKKYTIKEEDKPPRIVSKATKKVKKTSHNPKELDDVDLLEKVLIALMLCNSKK
jgi:hypothetical protein